MRAVIQRVRQAEVIVSGESVGKIGHGLLVFLGVEEDDTNDELEWMVNKILKLRIFEDEEEKMNLSVHDVEGELLVVSQFTLCADTRKGTRPSFIKAAKPDKAEPMYEDAVKRFKKSGLNVETGTFGAMMDIHLHNDGPVTLILDR